MNARPGGFNIPISFPGVSVLHNGDSEFQDTRSILEASLARSRPVILEKWGDANLHRTNDNEESGIAVGCQDGTVYVLIRSALSTSTTIDPQVPIDSTRPKHPTRFSKASHPNSGAVSPTLISSALSPTFTVTAKPRVVSGLTTEPVEAPKNYVDFEDEPDKLKDILKGKNPRERRSVSDTSSERTPKSSASSIIEATPASKRKHAVPRSLLSAANSRAPTPPPFSAPESPRESNLAPDLCAWSIRYHVIPAHSGFGYAVTAIQFLSDNRYFAVLHETGDLYVFSLDDGSCLSAMNLDEEVSTDTSTRTKERPRPRDTWVWRSLSVSHFNESVVLMAVAANDNNASALTPDTEEGSETSRCCLLEFVTTVSDVNLLKLGQWEFEGPATGDGFYEEQDGGFTFFSTGHNGHFITRDFKLRGVPLRPAASHPEVEDNHRHFGPHLSTLPIPNPFKSIMSHSSEHLLLAESQGQSSSQEKSRSFLSVPIDVGALVDGAALSGLTTIIAADKLVGLAWTHREITVFEYSQRSLKIVSHTAICGIKDAAWVECGVYTLSFEDRLEVYHTKAVGPENSDTVSHRNDHLPPDLVYSIFIGPHDVMKVYPNYLLVAKFSNELQQIVSYNIPDIPAAQSPGEELNVLWQPVDISPIVSKITLTAMLPLELDMIIQGYSDGYLRRFSLSQMWAQSEKPLPVTSAMKTSDSPLDGYLVGLHIIQNVRTREKYIVGGADDGSIAFWSLTTLELVARWTVFVTPLDKVVQFDVEKTSPLRGCALCIARDGTIAVIVVDGFHFLYLIPGSPASLKRMCLGGNELLLIYSDARVRLWDAQNRELRRSMTQDKAEELLAQGVWADLVLDTDVCVPNTLWKPVAASYGGRDAAASLVLNLEKLVVDAISVTKTISTSRDEIREIFLTLERQRLMLSALLTPGLNADVDSICYGKLGARASSAIVGVSSPSNTTIYQTSRSHDVWCISPKVTASRALAIIAVLRAMSLFEELTEAASTVISFYSTSLSLCVGPGYKPPSLEFLGLHWFEASNEFRQPIRTLFDATISNMSDEESIRMAEQWQHHVPTLQPDSEKEAPNAALALLITGCIASEKYTLMSTNALMDISKSISLYLHDEKSIYRVLAIDLCSRGFNVWQHYIDSMEILRSLFDLATNARKDSISIQNVGTQARLAVLSIASNNMPLLMGTLCLDILTPPTMEHRRSVMQILAFLIKKRPFVLQMSLPRLMEAVVKSLDPNATSDRELVLDTATEIIGYVVKTFPTVDFHMATQKLAVGTNEGAVVMYDLKTAIRLYVLEGHKKKITACSFSPDGRRLVTISLKESLVLVWKVGTSFTSFFNPGAPPRQGHSGSQPFKTLNFNVGSEAEIATSDILDLVRVEWFTDRSVKVKIRQSVLTFST
ncbi:hypothetical protein M413DRAFT_26286 [Hebeloma cylindrosporum]|uniref:Uncharacterized protein n=1 Tax=Hebeloma cylindrosporum TaxID=76867 RepID=A0A0C3C2G4_HEBCY|nr:hypothetical protein M413DRAFT_26286 [Hebeloma cylindrosporum h7]